MSITLREIANKVGGEILGQDSTLIHGPAKLEEASQGTISFYANEKYSKALESCQASAIIVAKTEKARAKEVSNYILVDDVYASLPILLSLFNVNTAFSPGIHASAVIDESASIGNNVHIGPHCIIAKNVIIADGAILTGQNYIGANASIGKSSFLHPGAKVYHDCKLGAHCIIHANAVIGADGFGFSPDASGNFEKIPQVGNVIIEDKVEIGANCTIDRASMGSTFIREGVKMDNLIHIAHNVDVGPNTVMAAQVGIAGSTKLGANCMIGGQVGIVGHLTIANGTQMQAQSGMIKSVKQENTRWYGYPAIEYNNYLRSFAGFKNLPATLATIRELKNRINALESSIQIDGKTTNNS